MRGGNRVDCRCRLSTSDVARALAESGVMGGWTGTPKRVEEMAEAVGVRLVEDWAGRPSMTVDDAARVRAEALRRRDAKQAEADRLHRETQAAKDAHQRAIREQARANGVPANVIVA